MKIKNQHSILTVLMVPLFLILSPTASAQSATDDAALRPLFDSHDVMFVRIEAPLKTLLKERPDVEYLAARFSYVDAAGEVHALDLKLRTRGKYRRKTSTCNFPPIRLNFRKKQVEGTDFAGQDKLKLVTHCQTGKKNFEQYVLREYLAYRIMQVLSDKSFGARMMRITYVDTENNDEQIKKYGFVIEDEDHIGARIGLTVSDVRSIKAEELDPRQSNLVSVFQYLIGNTDFSTIVGPSGTKCCHNIVLYEDGGAPYTPIPYDLDFAGIVDTPYAEPNPRFKIRTVKTRVYRGRCINNHLLDDTFAYFLEKEPEIRALVAELEGLDDRNRKNVTKYVDSFYKNISNPKAKDRKFIRECS